MMLLTKALRKKLPPLYTNEKIGLDGEVIVKFFTPDGQWTWYASEFDGDDMFYGLVDGDVAELGYFSLSELETSRGSWGLPIERDLHFESITLREAKSKARGIHV